MILPRFSQPSGKRHGHFLDDDMLRPRELTYAQALRQELSRHTAGLCRQDRRRTRHGAKLWHQHRKPRLGENFHVSGASEKAGLEHAVIDRVVQSGKDGNQKAFPQSGWLNLGWGVRG